MTADPGAPSWGDQIRDIHQEAAGLLSVEIIQPSDLPDLIVAALAGDARSGQTLRIINDTLHRIQTAPKRKPMLCGACPRVLRNGKYCIALAAPARDSPSQALAFAICNKCGTSREDVDAAAIRAVVKIWPETRPITVTHPTGGGSCH